jgi:hypothetical protein
MKVKELVEQLLKFNQDKDLYVELNRVTMYPTLFEVDLHVKFNSVDKIVYQDVYSITLKLVDGSTPSGFNTPYEDVIKIEVRDES